MAKYPVSEHGFSTPEFRLSSIPDTRRKNKREYEEREKILANVKKPVKHKLQIRIKKAGKIVKTIDQE